MLSWIVDTSLRHRIAVVAAAALLIAYGAYVAATSPYDVFPNFVPPQVEVQTEAPGFSPEEVERLVTRPLENVLNGVGNQLALRSTSIEGLSIVTVVFRQGTDVFRARQLVAERLSAVAERLPSGIGQPKMRPLTSSTMDLLKIGLVSERMSPTELRAFADWTLKPRLLAVPGVADIDVFGGAVRQLQVRVDPDRLLAHDLTLSDVLRAAQAATRVLGAGFIDTPNQRLTIQTPTPAWDPSRLASTVLATEGGTPVRLGDVAEIGPGAAPKVGDCLIQGKPGVLLALVSQYGANTLEVTRAVEAALKDFEPVLAEKGITLYPRLHRPATFIETALHNIRSSILIGAVLVIVVLLGFLGSLRASLVSLTAIPVSLLAAVIALHLTGTTLNTITIGGLAIAIGEVVDDAIIDLENILRRLRGTDPEAPPSSRVAVVRAASLEVRSAVVYATLVVILVFLPVLTLTGLQGSFFSPLAFAYILAVLASLGVAVTVTPALSFSLFAAGVPPPSEPRYLRWLKAAYGSLLRRTSRFPRAVSLGVALVALLTFAAVSHLGGELLPTFREGHLVLQVIAAPGTSLQEMRRLGARISQRLLATGQVATVEQQIGRAELAVDAWPPNRSELHVELKPMSGAEQLRAEARVREVLASVPGIQYQVATFLGDRIGESVSGEAADVVVNVFGTDLDAIDATAARVAELLRRIPGATDVRLKAAGRMPRVAITWKPGELARFGFTQQEVLEALAAAYRGVAVGRVYRGNELDDVVVVWNDRSRRDPRSVGSLRLRSPAGIAVPLAQLALVAEEDGRAAVSHEGARRRQTVTCNVKGRDLAAFVAEAKRRIAQAVPLPENVFLSFGGEAEARAVAERELFIHAAIAGAGVLILLGILFRSARRVALILLNLPFALAGGVLALDAARLFAGPSVGTITLGSLVGFVTLFGITTRNSIMLLSHYEHLLVAEQERWSLETAVRGACERLVPILMTATVTGLALVPLALGANEAGREIEGPMAIVILGGLITSTALNLLVLPTLSLHFGGFERLGPKRLE